MHMALEGGVCGAQTVCEFAHHIPAKIWHFLDHETEFLAVDHRKLCCTAGARCDGAWQVVQKRQDANALPAPIRSSLLFWAPMSTAPLSTTYMKAG